VGAFGERLKKEREKKNISLDEVALATKIGTRMLRAIEEERFEQLPGGIFNKGFVRAYAKHLGLNEEEAIADYFEAYRASLPVEEPVAVPHTEAVGSQAPNSEHFTPIAWKKTAAALLLLIAVVGAGVWSFRSHASKSQTNGIKVEQPEQKQSVVSQPSTPKSQSSQSESAKPKLQDETPPAIQATQPAAGTIENASATTSDSVRVLIRAREDAWLLIMADGKEIMRDTLLAESQRLVTARSELIIKAGNVGALEFWFNGKKLSTQGDLDQVKTLSFDATGLVATNARIQPISSSVDIQR
jgi:cytoskeleton protein RodZ